MTDLNLNPSANRPGSPESPAERGADPIWDIIELLFFAYRDFVSDPDDVLAKLAFGRAHHRVLHFVNRNPGMKVADLLDILKITKQSLGRVLKQLVDQGYIVQKEGANDRRQRLLDRGQVACPIVDERDRSHSRPFVDGSIRARRRSRAQATRSARANALNTASTL